MKLRKTPQHTHPRPLSSGCVIHAHLYQSSSSSSFLLIAACLALNASANPPAMLGGAGAPLPPALSAVE